MTNIFSGATGIEMTTEQRERLKPFIGFIDKGDRLGFSRNPEVTKLKNFLQGKVVGGVLLIEDLPILYKCAQNNCTHYGRDLERNKIKSLLNEWIEASNSLAPARPTKEQKSALPLTLPKILKQERKIFIEGAFGLGYKNPVITPYLDDIIFHKPNLVAERLAKDNSLSEENLHDLFLRAVNHFDPDIPSSKEIVKLIGKQLNTLPNFEQTLAHFMEGCFNKRTVSGLKEVFREMSMETFEVGSKIKAAKAEGKDTTNTSAPQQESKSAVTAQPSHDDRFNSMSAQEQNIMQRQLQALKDPEGYRAKIAALRNKPLERE